VSHEDYLYTESHEWIEPEGETRMIGITDHAQHMLGDIVFVDLPEAGMKVNKSDELLVIESPKAAAEVYAPVSGEIVEVNPALEDAPETVNKDPFSGGWLVKIKVSDPSESETLMKYTDYQKIVEG